MVKRFIGANRELRAKRDRAAFSVLIGTPGSGALTMPANGRILLRSVAGCAAGTTAATVSGRTIKTPLLSAGEDMVLGWLERAVILTPSLGFDVLLDIGLGRTAKIGEGV